MDIAVLLAVEAESCPQEQVLLLLLTKEEVAEQSWL